MYDRRNGRDSIHLHRKMREEEDKARLKRKKEQTEKKNSSTGNLSISQPEDASEKEADAIARKVVNGQHAEPPADFNTGASIQTKSETESLHSTADLQTQLSSSKGGGQSLDDSTKGEMESKMGTDFSDVKIHTGASADAMNESVNAKAFAHGKDIYFKNGNYNPSSLEGKELLAHELVHTQQRQGDGHIHRSALAEKKPEQKEIVISTCMNYFGPGAEEGFAKTTTEGIQQYWNDAMGSVVINEEGKDVEYSVRFVLTYQVYPANKFTNAQVQEIAIGKMGDPSQSYIETYNVRPSGKVSSMTGNKGIFYSMGADKSEFAHEYGHGLGFNGHPKAHQTVTVIDDKTGKKYQAADFRGYDSIMVPDPNEEGGGFNIVDEKYRKDSKATITPDANDPKIFHASSMDANMDPDQRKVTKTDIDNLNLATLLKDSTTANLGGKTTVNWWGGDSGKIDLQTELPVIDRENYMPGMLKYEKAKNLQALKETGKKDAQFIQIVYMDFRFESPDNPQNGGEVLRYFDNPQLGERTNNADAPEMKGMYSENTVRYIYVDRASGYVSPYHPINEVNGIPPPNTKCLSGESVPVPL